MIKFTKCIAGILSVAGFSALLWLLSRSGDAGFAPMAAMFSGWAFTERAIITGGALDQPSLHKELFILSFSFVALCPTIAVVRRINGHSPRIVRRLFAIASLIILAHPFSILTIFTWDVSRYIYHMGVTPMRLAAFASAICGYVTISAFAAWVSGVNMGWLSRNHAFLIFLMYPLSLLTIFTYFVYRYVFDMGVSPVVVAPLALAIFGYATLSVFAAWMWGLEMRCLNKRVDTYLPPGADAG